VCDQTALTLRGTCPEGVFRPFFNGRRRPLIATTRISQLLAARILQSWDNWSDGTNLRSPDENAMSLVEKNNNCSALVARQVVQDLENVKGGTIWHFLFEFF